MNIEIIELVYRWVNDIAPQDFFIFNYVSLEVEVNMEDMKILLEQGIMTQQDIDIILDHKDVIIADVEDILNQGLNEIWPKREIIKRLMICLVKEHKLSLSYTKYFIKQFNDYL